jgi:hypothetical protein
MPTLTSALVARQSESPSNRTPRSGSAHALTGTLEGADRRGARRLLHHCARILAAGRTCPCAGQRVRIDWRRR